MTNHKRTTPSPPVAASSAAAEARLSVARSYLEAGAKLAQVATVLQARFHISRATAYRDCAAASEQLDLCDNGPASDEIGPDPESLQALLAHRLTIACAVGDAKEIATLTKALDTAKRWTGTLQTTANPYA